MGDSMGAIGYSLVQTIQTRGFFIKSSYLIILGGNFI